MGFEHGAIILETYGDFIRVGKEGKWVEFIKKQTPPLSRKELIALVEEMDKERTQ